MADGIENEGMSLADIAGIDTSEIEELRSSALPVGLYTFECQAGKLEDRMVKDDTERRVVVSVPMKVVEVDTIAEKDVSESDVMGKTQTEQFFIDPSEAEKGIGYLKGWLADIGADNSGNMGGVDGAPAGYLDRLESHRFKAKIIKKKSKDGNYYSRLQLLPKKKAA